MRIIIIDDTRSWFESLMFSIEPLIDKTIINIKLIPDGSFLEQEIAANGADYIFIDYDLGSSTGDKIIAEIDSSPEFMNIPIVFYSAGKTISELKDMVKSFGHVECLVREDVRRKIISLVQ